MELTAQVWVQAITMGFALGWLYVLLALGLTLILGIMNILQFAHGEVYMIGAYIVYYLSVSWGINLYAAMLLSMLAMAGFGVFIEKFLFRPVQSEMSSVFAVALGLALILQSAAAVGFGLYERSLDRLATGYFEILGGAVPKDRIIAVVFAVVLLLLVYLFLKRSKYGQAMVASAQNREGSLLRGISSNQMSGLAMAIGCALAAAAGTMAGSILMLTPYMGILPLMKGLVIIVLGGLGSLAGAAIGGIILGLIDGIIPVVFGPAPAAVAPLIIVIIFLLLRPQGLFGHE